jgi:hypothetical protein
MAQGRTLVTLPHSIVRGLSKLDSFVTATYCISGRIDPAWNLKLARGNRFTTKFVTECTATVGATAVGPVFATPYVCRSCVHNAVQAFTHRHGIAAPRADREALFDARAYAIRLRDLIRVFAEVRLPPLVFGEWLARWPVEKQRAILRSIEEDEILPSELKSNIKRECSSFDEPPSKARLIQAYPNLATQAQFACQFYAIQKSLCDLGTHEAIPGSGVTVTYASGLNASSLGEWATNIANDGGSYTWYERDGKAWDATMQYEHFRITEIVYEIFGPQFLRFVRAGYDCKGKVTTKSGVMKYSVKGTRKSGHNDTTLGNNIINAAITVAALLAHEYRGHIIVAGDDLLVAIHGPHDLASLMAYEVRCGIRPEAASFRSRFSSSFISGCFYQSLNHPRSYFIPRPGRVLRRISWTVKPPSRRDTDSYLYGVACGLDPVLGRMPLIRVILANWKRRTHRTELTDRRYYVYRRAPPVDFGRDVDIMTWFCSRYDVGESEVAEAERLIAAAFDAEAYGRVAVSHPTIDRVIAYDEYDAPERPANALDQHFPN